jgi:hypothetical protein
LPEKEDGDASLAVEMVTRATNQQQVCTLLRSPYFHCKHRFQEYERQSHEALLRQRQLETENAAALARQIDEKKEEKRRLRIYSTPTEVPDETFDGGIATNVFAFNTEIKCKGYLFHSVTLSNPINGTLSS